MTNDKGTMQIIRDLTEAHLTESTVLTIGTFDGLHRGHQALIRQLKTAARQLRAKSAVIAFHPRPKAVFVPERYGNDYLTTPDERIALFKSLGLDILVLVPFTLELAQIMAYDFVKLVVESLNVVQFWVGHDFALGKNREGNVEKLAELSAEFNYTLREIEPFLLDSKVVSSSEIRQQLLTGEVRQAAHLLGRYPSLTGKIVLGARRGRTIGFPTANFAVPAERLVPANGVYATFVRRPDDDRRLASVTNIGVRPSFDGQERTVESFIFDFDKDIYDQTFTLEFVERLRPEKKFDGIEALVNQITRDSEQARSLLAKEIIAA